MNYDKIILHIGEFGPYQRRIYLLLCLPSIMFGFHSMAGVFLAARTDFRCLLPYESLENATYQLSSNFTKLAYPWDNKTKSWPQCERYDVHLIDHSHDLDRNLLLTTPMVKCNSFVYDKTTYKLTTVTEFNLVCDNAWLRSASDSLYMAGAMLGGITFGLLSDRYGRKPIFYLSLVIDLVSGLITAASPNIISFMILRLIIGLSAYGLFLISYVTGKRSNANMMFVPESVRWLLTKGRLEEAKDLLLKASSKNGIELSRDMLDNILSNDREQVYGQMGGTLAPAINHLALNWIPLPSIILGCGSLMAGLSALLLPETLNKKLPDSIEESERFGRQWDSDLHLFSIQELDGEE